MVELWLGLDKICLEKIEQNGQPEERSNSASKMGTLFTVSLKDYLSSLEDYLSFLEGYLELCYVEQYNLAR